MIHGRGRSFKSEAHGPRTITRPERPYRTESTEVWAIPLPGQYSYARRTTCNGGPVAPVTGRPRDCFHRGWYGGRRANRIANAVVPRWRTPGLLSRGGRGPSAIAPPYEPAWPDWQPTR